MCGRRRSSLSLASTLASGLGLSSSLLRIILREVLLRELTGILRSEDDGVRVAGDRVTVLAILDLIAVQRGELDIVGGRPGRAAERSVNVC